MVTKTQHEWTTIEHTRRKQEEARTCTNSFHLQKTKVNWMIGLLELLGAVVWHAREYIYKVFVLCYYSIFSLNFNFSCNVLFLL